MAETMGSLIDKLTVANLKIWHQEEVAQAAGASDKVVANAKRKISTLNLQRNALIQEIDEYFVGIVTGKIQVPRSIENIKDYRTPEAVLKG